MQPLQDLSLDELHNRTVSVYRQGGSTRPEVSLVRLDTIEAVLKDYNRSDPWFSRIFGTLLAQREASALLQLQGISGVPALIARVDKKAVLIRYVAGKDAKQFNSGELPESFFRQLYDLVSAIHQRGVAHCDLRSFGNILVTESGSPCLVDFVSRIRQAKKWNLYGRWLFDKFCQADIVAIARLKQRLAPELLTAEEKARLARDRKSLLERVARMIGKSVRNLSRWLLTKRS